MRDKHMHEDATNLAPADSAHGHPAAPGVAASAGRPDV
jgi:hypothetical protein